MAHQQHWICLSGHPGPKLLKLQGQHSSKRDLIRLLPLDTVLNSRY